ncbi:MAG TPA: GAF domain-containing protein, partial [Candidatus Bathyarchaeia archaeon]|nr:GAF domain-containing protein [Candidatus Bathyarchaeia archaeon]
MASTTKRGVNKSRAKERRTVVKKSQPKQNIQSLQRALDESLEREAATSDILRMIAKAPGDLQTVLDAIAERAARLCDAGDAGVWRVHGDHRRRVAHFGAIPTAEALGEGPILDRGTPPGRAIINRQTIHVHDLQAAEAEFPGAKTRGIALGVRTVLVAPLLHAGVASGAIQIRRQEVRPFSDKQIKLLETFADQAVIAIENARLFQESQASNRDLTEALEQQTATSEMLRVIASSPTDLQPVLNVVVENAARLCDSTDAQLRLVDEGVLRLAASYGPLPLPEIILISRQTVSGRAVTDRQVIHVHDLEPERETEYPEAAQDGSRTVLGVPLLREGIPIGAILIRRLQVRPFNDKQIALLKTFADQAVIAIENVRLFQELKQSLEQQTATSEILGVIASSPTDIQPVLDVVVKNAARLCDAKDATIFRVDGGDMLHRAAAYGPMPGTEIRRPITRGSVPGRAVIDRQTIHVRDMSEAEAEDEFPDTKRAQQITGTRTILATPLLREDLPLGSITVRRQEVRPFSEKQVSLLKTFADQAVIAIENVRLFQELKEALEQQTATSEILGVIASSPTDIQPVLDAVATNAARLCEATDAQIRLVEGNRTRLVASFGKAPAPELSPISSGRVGGRAILDRKTIHVHDLLEASKTEYPDAGEVVTATGTRTILGTPMLREGTPIGVINIRRTEVRPFSEQQIKLLETFADQAVIAIENVRLFQELEARTGELARSVGELKALGEVGQAVSSTLDLQTVLSAIVGHAVQLSGTSGGVIYEFDEAAQEFHLRASFRMEGEIVQALHVTPVRPGQGATGQMATVRAPVQVPDILEEREYTGTRVRPMLARLG